MRKEVSFPTAALIIVIAIALLIAAYYFGLGEALPAAGEVSYIQTFTGVACGSSRTNHIAHSGAHQASAAVG